MATLNQITKQDELHRLEALGQYASFLLDHSLDDLAALASNICESPIALISIFDAEGQKFIGTCADRIDSLPLENALCRHVLATREPLEVSDISQDDRLPDSPFVNGDRAIRFYAGWPLIIPAGHAVGTLCVLDFVPRTLSDVQRDSLRILSQQVITHFEMLHEKQVRNESEMRLKVVTENARVGLTVIDAGHRYIYTNSTYLEVIGWRSSNVLGMHMSDVLPEIYDEQVRPRLARAFTGENVRYVASGAGDLDGRYFDVNYQPTRADNGAYLVLGVVTDITEYTLAQNASRRLAAVVESSIDAIIGEDLDGTITSWNQGAAKTFGYAADEMVGKSIRELIPPERQQEEFEMLGRIRAGEIVDHLDTKRLTRDGRLIDVSVTVSPIRDISGEIMGASKVIRDVTERHLLEQQYHQAQKMEAIGRLAGGIAHDFNNLLTAILGYCELLLAELDDDDPRNADVLEIQNAGKLAAALTGQLLAFSRKQVVAPAVLDVNQVLGNMQDMLKRLIGEDVRVVLNLGQDVHRIQADPGQVEQVVMNLAVNARDAMPQGGTLTIETVNVELDAQYARRHVKLDPGSYVALVISDTGDGMLPEIQSRLFEPFFTTKEVGKGTGLGLASVHGIVKSCGGGVDVHSEIGRGTSFRVFLPAHGEGAAAAEPDAHDRSSGGTETVLVVEDAETLRSLAKRQLAHQGYKVLLASDATEALEVFEAHPTVDVLLTDVVMPGVSGPELVAQLVEQRPSLKVIYMSGFTEDAVAEQVVLESASGFIRKPFSSQALGEKIREVLDG